MGPCALGCLAPDGLEDYDKCPMLCTGVAVEGGPQFPLFGIASANSEPQWRQLAVASEVDSAASHAKATAPCASRLLPSTNGRRARRRTTAAPAGREELVVNQAQGVEVDKLAPARALSLGLLYRAAGLPTATHRPQRFPPAPGRRAPLPPPAIRPSGGTRPPSRCPQLRGSSARGTGALAQAPRSAASADSGAAPAGRPLHPLHVDRPVRISPARRHPPLRTDPRALTRAPETTDRGGAASGPAKRRLPPSRCASTRPRRSTLPCYRLRARSRCCSRCSAAWGGPSSR